MKSEPLPPVRPVAPGAIDFAAAWRAWLEGAADPRLDRTTDLAFWERVADDCDQWAQPCTRLLAELRAWLRPGDTLLDIGAGTGRLAIPLAASCRSVTALDQSAALLRVLRRKADATGTGNITTVLSGWEEATVEPHDVVLAAWSLYRQLDIEAALRRMMAATRRLLVLIVPDADRSQRQRGETPAYLYILGALRELGALAELTMIFEPQADGTGTVPVPVITWRTHAIEQGL